MAPTLNPIIVILAALFAFWQRWRLNRNDPKTRLWIAAALMIAGLDLALAVGPAESQPVRLLIGALYGGFSGFALAIRLESGGLRFVLILSCLMVGSFAPALATGALALILVDYALGRDGIAPSIDSNTPAFSQMVDADRPFLSDLDEGVIISDELGTVVFANSAATRLLDAPLSELLGESIMSLLSTLPMVMSRPDGSANPESARFEFNGRPLSGRMHLIHRSSDDETSDEISIVGTMAIIGKDGSAGGQMVDEPFLRQVKGTMTQALTHLTAHAQLLQADQMTPHIDRLLRVNRSIQRYLDLSTEAVVNVGERTDCQQVIEAVVSKYQAEAVQREIQLLTMYDSEMVPLSIRSSHLETILDELLTNAFRFTPDGGNVSVSAEIAGETALQIAVVDTGIGVSDGIKGAILALFSGDRSGSAEVIQLSGIGFSLIQSLMGVYDGRVWIESPVSEGAGTRVTLVFPISPEGRKRGE